MTTPNVPTTPEEIVNQWWSEQAHPQAPSVTVGDYPVAARLANLLKFGQGSATGEEIAMFWKEFQSMNEMLMAMQKLPYSPEEFAHSVELAAKLSFAYHGRPPSMYEMARLRDAHPREVHDWFGSLPDRDHPHISAADMVKSLTAAGPWAKQALQRSPNKTEAAYLHHSGEHPGAFYGRMAEGSDGRQS